MRKSKLTKKKGRLQLKNKKDTWCNHSTEQGGSYKR